MEKWGLGPHIKRALVLKTCVWFPVRIFTLAVAWGVRLDLCQEAPKRLVLRTGSLRDEGQPAKSQRPFRFILRHLRHEHMQKQRAHRLQTTVGPMQA